MIKEGQLYSWTHPSDTRNFGYDPEDVTEVLKVCEVGRLETKVRTGSHAGNLGSVTTMGTSQLLTDIKFGKMKIIKDVTLPVPRRTSRLEIIDAD